MAKTRGRLNRSQRHAANVLRKKGLQQKPASKQKPTRYFLDKIKRFADVITGNASVVTVKEKGARKRYREVAGVKGVRKVRVHGKKVVVPRERESERATYDKKTGMIKIVRRSYGRREVEYIPGFANLEAIRRWERDHEGRFQFVIRWKWGGVNRFTTASDLQNFIRSSAGMLKYEDQIANYVGVIDLDDELEDEEGEE